MAKEGQSRNRVENTRNTVQLGILAREQLYECGEPQSKTSQTKKLLIQKQLRPEDISLISATAFKKGPPD